MVSRERKTRLPLHRVRGEVILSKRHELSRLSNFAATPFKFHGKRYASGNSFRVARTQSTLQP